MTDLDEDEDDAVITCRMCGVVYPDDHLACPHSGGMTVEFERDALAILNRSPASAWKHKGRSIDGEPWYETIDVELEGWTFGAYYRGFGWSRIDYAIAPDGQRWDAYAQPGDEHPRLAHSIAEYWTPTHRVTFDELPWGRP